MMKMLKTVHKQKISQQRLDMRIRAAKHQKEAAKQTAKRDATTKEMRKRMYRIQGKMAPKKKP